MLWTIAEMTKRLDWEKARLAGKKKISLADEGEFRDHDLAARWIARAEQQQSDKQKATAKHKPSRTRKRKH